MTILGMMSGTSLDGVDMAVCQFEGTQYKILDATTARYSYEWKQRLATLEDATSFDYALADVQLGHLFGQLAASFLNGKTLKVDAIASHGHTIFHQPHLGLTTQIGNADAIAAETHLPVVSNFRTLDVALGGQGAPLVPIGDELLFPQYDACLNLGGIANISYRDGDNRVAFDICPCNMVLNRLATRLGLDYDPEGVNARSGNLHTCLNHRLNQLDYYSQPGPKSLGKEWFLASFWPLVEASHAEVCDLLHTATAHVAQQIARVLQHRHIHSMLVTGGGAFNTYLIEQIAEYSPSTQLHVPDPLIVNYKEALVFALLGYLRLNGKVNTLSSVTGASCNSTSGNISGLF